MRYAFGFRPFPENASKAEIIAHKHDEPDVSDWVFRRNILEGLPLRFAIPVALRYNTIHESKGRREANLFLLDVKDDLDQRSLKLSASDDELIDFAKQIAEECRYYRSQFQTPKKALLAVTTYIKRRHAIDIASRFNKIFSTDSLTEYPHIGDPRIDTPLIDSPTIRDPNIPVTVTGTAPVTDTVTVTEVSKDYQRNVTGILNRLCDDKWWRTTLRNITIRNVEKYGIDLGMVHKKANIYVSNESFERIKQQKRRNKRKLENTFLVNEAGEEFSLLELAEHSLANPKNRRNEIMTRVRGMEEVAKAYDLVGMFYTITCPSRMHARYSASGDENPKYDGTDPRQAQQYLVKLWSLIRAKLDRMGVLYYGIRVAEPHHDATPHWHLLLFVGKRQRKALTTVLREYALRDSPDEDGAQERRFEVEKINPSKGSATGYVAKYISKSIDGYGLDEDLYGNEASTAAERIVAWASVWKIRQFQTVGGPPVSVWRELRRISGNDLTGALKQAHTAADNKKWGEFIEAMGGPFAKRKERPIQVSRTWSDEPNRYQEPKGYKITGVEAGNVTVLTRLHTWTLKTDNTPNLEDLNQWKPIPIKKIEDSPDYDQGIFEKIRGWGS